MMTNRQAALLAAATFKQNKQASSTDVTLTANVLLEWLNEEETRPVPCPPGCLGHGPEGAHVTRVVDWSKDELIHYRVVDSDRTACCVAPIRTLPPNHRVLEADDESVNCPLKGVFR